MSTLAEGFAPARIRVDVASLLPIVAPLAMLAVALAFAAPGLTVQDTWSTLVAGREVAQHGLPSSEHLTALASGRPWVDQQWLAQLVLYAASRVGGVGLALALCIAATILAFGLCASIARRRAASPLPILLFVGWAVVAAPWGLQLRAQTLALPLFALLLWALDRDAVPLALLVLTVWANVHGSVVVGVAIAVVYAVARRVPLLLLAPAAVFASPYALRLPGYYRMMLFDPPFGAHIAEWKRTSPAPLTAAFFILAAVALVLVWRRRSVLGVLPIVALAVSLFVAVDAIRGIVWFALAALAFLPALATRERHRAELRGTTGVALASLTVAGALVFAAARPADAYEAAIPPHLDTIAAGHSVFANETTADWLLWKVPSLRGRVAYDVRFEVLTPRRIARLLAWRNFGPGWTRAVAGYDLVVDDPAHVSRLVAAGGWHRVLVWHRVAVAERDRR